MIRTILSLETEASNHDIGMLDQIKKCGGAHVDVGNRRLWSNSRVIVGKMKEETMRRVGRQSLGVVPETKPWGKVIQDAMLLQMEMRERKTKSGCHQGNQDG